MCMCMPSVCRCLKKPGEGIRSPVAGPVGSCESLDEYWEVNSGPLEE